MPDFSFCGKKEKCFPTAIDDNGVSVAVDADFRTVIRCIGVLGKSNITDHQKRTIIRALFFGGVFVSDPAWLFFEFIKETSKAPDDGKRVMDFWQDQDAIYASFLQQYGLDLTEIEFLHWYKFRALLAGLGEDTPLGLRIRIRTLDTRKLDVKDRAKIERLKRMYALDESPMDDEEKRLHEAVDKAMTEGRDPAVELKALKDYYEQQDGGAHG